MLTALLVLNLFQAAVVLWLVLRVRRHQSALLRTLCAVSALGFVVTGKDIGELIAEPDNDA